MRKRDDTLSLFSWDIKLELEMTLGALPSLVSCPTFFCKATAFFSQLVHKLGDAMLLPAKMLVLGSQFKNFI